MLEPDRARNLAISLVGRGLAAGATSADALYGGSRSSSVEVRMGELEKVDRSEGERIGVRLFVGQRSATVAGSDLSDEGLDILVERCLAMAREAPEDEYAGLAPTEMLFQGEPTDLDLGDGVDPDPVELRTRAVEAERAALAVPGVANSGGAGASASGGIVALATSGGFAGAYASGGHSLSASVVAGEGAAMQRDYAHHTVRYLADLDQPEGIGREAARRAVARLGSGRAKPGRYPILFDPRVASSLLGHFAGAITGSAVARGSSFLKDKLGEAIFANGVTITDDPLRRRGLRSRPFDSEGLPVAQRHLVADGVLTQWIADSAAARQLGIAPTGHASRGVGGIPGAAPSNLFMVPGSRSPAEMMAAFPELLLVTELIGQGINSVTGDYSRGAAGFMIRGGAIAEPVSEITVASNLIAMFETLEPASDLDFRRGIDAPTILVPDMAVASA